MASVFVVGTRSSLRHFLYGWMGTGTLSEPCCSVLSGLLEMGAGLFVHVFQ